MDNDPIYEPVALLLTEFKQSPHPIYQLNTRNRMQLSPTQSWIEFNCVDCGTRTYRPEESERGRPFYLFRLVCVSCQKPDDVQVGK